MVNSFRHKGLKELFEKGRTNKISPQVRDKCLRRLDFLDASDSPEDMNQPGFRFHALNGNPKRFSVWVTGNWRITFGWTGADAEQVDYEDYH